MHRLEKKKKETLKLLQTWTNLLYHVLHITYKCTCIKSKSN